MEQTTETVRTTPQTPPESRPHPASPSPLPSSERDLRWRRASRSPRFRRLLILILIVLLVVGFFLWRYFTSYESTDDAQIDGHLNAISARISGHVEKLLVDDNQYVNAGTPLVQIDPRDYQVAVDRAKADFADALAAAQGAGECSDHFREHREPIERSPGGCGKRACGNFGCSPAIRRSPGTTAAGGSEQR